MISPISPSMRTVYKGEAINGKRDKRIYAGHRAYVEILGSSVGKKLPILEVIIGPSHLQQENFKRATSALKRLGVAVSLSETPSL